MGQSASITVDYPNLGEYIAGSAITVRWSYTGTIDTFGIEYSTNGGTSWNHIAYTANRSSYKWTIPAIASTRYRIKVYSKSNPTVSDQSNANFSVVPGVIGSTGIIPGDVKIDGNLNMLDEFSTLYTVPIEMPDGIKLMTDIYIPMTQDCMAIVIDSNFVKEAFGTNLFGNVRDTLTLIPKGIQLFYYDKLNGGPNPEPYSLPMILTRTPYDKTGDLTGRIICLFGYAYAMSDMRGRYSSEGVYFPMMSDSWNKNPYHNYFKHILDHTDFSDPKNGNRHEDGYWTVQGLVNDVTRTYDVDNDGDLETFRVCNGSLGTFGGSALGNTQYQEAAAHKINPMGPGMKGMFPIVATLEHYRYTGYQNGVFRERIVTGWLKGQIFDIEDDLIDVDYDKQNNIHTSADYDLPKAVTVNNRTKIYQVNQFDASALAIDHFVRMRYPVSEGGPAGLPGYYPNSRGRGDMDGSHAKVDVNGESVKKGKIVNGRVVDCEDDNEPGCILGFGNSPRPNLIYSRYRNMDVPCYHLTGWWDIFTDGQIETWRLMKEALHEIGSKNAKLQKLIIGPWVHQTIGGTKTGDILYKENATDILGFDIGDVDIEDLAVEDVLRSEIVGWFRYNLNYNDYANIGLPKVRLPESRVWQEIGSGTIRAKVKVPSADYVITFNELINFINGTGDLKGLPAEARLYLDTFLILSIDTAIDIPPLNKPVIKELDGKAISAAIDSIDFSKVKDARFYVIGPINDRYVDIYGRTNEFVGNYWFHADTFPLVDSIRWKTMYMHRNGKLDYNAPTEDEGYTIYIHDPDDQVYTIGGANMIVDLPFGHISTVKQNSRSQGQINLADPRWRHTTMDRQGVVAFETEVLSDTLCVIGFPEVKLYAKSNPGGEVDGPTDTDFFVRILDVYPDYTPNDPRDDKEYFVVEGCVNARARDYAKALAEADGLENDSIDNIPFTNIEIGKIYEYHFRLMPIAYTWGYGHKMKILISSSNHTRYQVNPNLPIEDGDFFRRQPLDGQKYIFNGVEMEPRIAVQRIAHSPEYPTSISLPVYKTNHPPTTAVPEVKVPHGSGLNGLIYPNPASDELNVYMSRPHQDYELVMLNDIGQKVYTATFRGELKLNAARFDRGIYIIQVNDIKTKEKFSSKVTIQ